MHNARGNVIGEVVEVPSPIMPKVRNLKGRAWVCERPSNNMTYKRKIRGPYVLPGIKHSSHCI